MTPSVPYPTIMTLMVGLCLTMPVIFWYYITMTEIFKTKNGSIDWGFIQGLSLLVLPMVVAMF